MRVFWTALLFGVYLGRSFGSATEWPEFRGPTGQGISEAKNVPVSWSATNGVAWKVEAPEGWSSPVVSGGKIFVTGATMVEGQTSLRALAFEVGSGKSVWDVEVFRHASTGPKHKKNGLASPTPVVREGKIYVHFGHLGTAAVDLGGKVIWKQESIKYPPLHGNGGSPALVGDVLIFSCDGSSNPFLAGLDAKTGEVKWKTPRNTAAKSQFSFSTPLAIQVDGREVVVSPFSGFVGGYTRDGKELWRVGYGEGYSIIPRPVFAHGLLFIGSGYDRPVLYAINPSGIKGDATEKAIVWQQAKGAPNTPSALMAGNELYVVSDAGIATCFDAKSGETHWAERLGGGFSASPALAEGRIYFQNEEGIGFVVKAGTQFELLSKNDLGERSLASPAIVDGAVILRTATHLWRIGK